MESGIEISIEWGAERTVEGFGIAPEPDVLVLLEADFGAGLASMEADFGSGLAIMESFF